jgi:competence protein ComEC
MPFTALAAPLLVYIQGIAHVTAAAPLATVTIHPSPFAIVAGWVTLAATALTALRRWSHAHVASEADRTRVADASAPRPGASRAGRSRAGEIAASVGDGSLAGGAAVGGGSRADHAALDDSGFPRRGRVRSLRLGVRPRLVAVFAAAVGVALVAAGGVDGRRASAPQPGETVVSFLDVGQGDATLIQRGSASVLVDTGPPDGPILSRLKDAGIERLDALVVTHAEADHEGAAPAVISRYRPRLVLDGGAGWASRVQRVLPAIAAAAHSRVLAPAAGDEIALGGMRVKVLWPPPRTASWRAEGNPNDRAVVARLEAGGLSVLLTADAESPVTAPLELEPVDVLKVAHHGSSDPGLPALLQRLKPRIAAIEVGERNEYGHPTPSTLAALNAAVPTVLRTDRDGTVRLHAAGGRMWIERRGG